MSHLKFLAIPVAVLGSCSAWAWGNEGHQIVATIAQHYLSAKTSAAVNALIAQDTSTLTAHTLAAEATWADAYRASSMAARNATHNWHFADIEVVGGTLKAACFGFPALPAGTPASAGPAKDCHVDKISEALAELKPSATTTTAERVLALQYVLHFVGDVHQPLHSSDQNDAGGNGKNVSATASKLGTGNLHAFWDSHLVASFGTNFTTVATQLQSTITPANFKAWYRGTPADWAQDAYQLGVSTAYGMLPQPDATGVYVLPASYVHAAEIVVGTQLSKAGVRLAYALNQTFDPRGAVPNKPKAVIAASSARGVVMSPAAARSMPPSPAFLADDMKYNASERLH